MRNIPETKMNGDQLKIYCQSIVMTKYSALTLGG